MDGNFFARQDNSGHKQELWFLLMIYCPIVTQISTVSLKYFKGLRSYGVHKKGLKSVGGLFEN